MGLVPWKKTGDPQVLAKGYGKSFTKQDFLDHAGKPTDFYFFDQPSWSVILALTEDGNVLTVRQFKQGAEEIIEELPGGQANFAGEDPAAVIRRELLEETGYSSDDVAFLGWDWMNSRNSHTKFFGFLAKGCRKTASPHLDPSEQMEIAERPLAEWMKMAFGDRTVGWGSSLLTLWALPSLNFTIREK